MRTAKASRPLTNLPVELQIHVLSYLTSIVDHIFASQVCKLWNEIILKDPLFLRHRYTPSRRPLEPDEDVTEEDLHLIKKCNLTLGFHSLVYCWQIYNPMRPNEHVPIAISCEVRDGVTTNYRLRCDRFTFNVDLDGCSFLNEPLFSRDLDAAIANGERDPERKQVLENFVQHFEKLIGLCRIKTAIINCPSLVKLVGATWHITSALQTLSPDISMTQANKNPSIRDFLNRVATWAWGIISLKLASEGGSVDLELRFAVESIITKERPSWTLAMYVRDLEV